MVRGGINNNKAHVGGGIVVSNATALMHSVACEDNYAEVQGGAIVTFNSGLVEVCGGAVSDNFARVTGGALAINVGHLCKCAAAAGA